jgi:Iap family predicted aminopeptidase
MPEKGIARSFLLVYSDAPPDSILLRGVDDYYNSLGYNVIGMLPGKSKPDEIILFSAHYDHMGVNRNKRRDSILNGANDDASGVTALLLLANYFAKKGDNERTILFCAFSGEELGLRGSANFINYLNPEKIIAGINIEMIGVPQYGMNTVFITGTQYSTLPSILKSNMKEAGIKIKPEPDLRKKLFQRSDNYTFAKNGVPAHTIMSSDDDDRCYHKPCDEINRINIAHMTQVIGAIALASESLINGKETPTRVKVEDLK